MKNFSAFTFGAIFSIGLMLSGMSNPEKVLAFLDISEQWNPSLALVMLGAICTAILPIQFKFKQEHPQSIFHEPIDFPKTKRIDKKLVIGASLFGIGWGIAGICPAPSLTLIGLGYYQAFYFIIPMIIAMLFYKHIAKGH